MNMNLVKKLADKVNMHGEGFTFFVNETKMEVFEADQYLLIDTGWILNPVELVEYGSDDPDWNLSMDYVEDDKFVHTEIWWSLLGHLVIEDRIYGDGGSPEETIRHIYHDQITI